MGVIGSMSINEKGNLVVSSAALAQREIFQGSESLPNEIKSETIVHQPRKIGFDSPEKFQKYYTSMKNLISNFDERIEEELNEIPNETMKTQLEHFSETLIQDVKDKVGESKVKITRVLKDNLIDKSRDPTILFTTWKHYKLARFFFEGLKYSSEIENEFSEMSQNEFDEYIENNFDAIKFGVFVAAEPFLVIFAFYADRNNDMEFIMNYSDLVDTFAHKLARAAPEIYKDVMNFNRDIFNENKATSLINNLYTEKGAI